MMRKQFWAVLAAVAVAAVAVAQNLPVIKVSVRTSGVYSAAVSTNQPTACSTNIAGLTRAYIQVWNNADQQVVVYAGTTTNTPIGYVAPAGNWVRQWPIVDNGTFSVGSTGTAVNVTVTEGWGN
jgi:hypothetical protein